MMISNPPSLPPTALAPLLYPPLLTHSLTHSPFPLHHHHIFITISITHTSHRLHSTCMRCTRPRARALPAWGGGNGTVTICDMISEYLIYQSRQNQASKRTNERLLFFLSFLPFGGWVGGREAGIMMMVMIKRISPPCSSIHPSIFRKHKKERYKKRNVRRKLSGS